MDKLMASTLSGADRSTGCSAKQCVQLTLEGMAMGRESMVVFLVCVAAMSSVVLADGPTARLANAKVVKVLSGKDEVRRSQAIAMLRNNPSSAEALLEPLIALARDQAEQAESTQLVSPVMVDLLHVIGKVDRPQSETLLIELLDCKQMGVSMVAADVVGTNKMISAIQPLIKQVDRAEFETSYGFRFNLVRALALMEHRDAVVFLDKLRASLDGQLRYELDKLMSNVTAGSFDDDEDAFQSWKQSRESKIKLASSPSKSEYDDRMRLGPSPQYYGIDLHSKRMMFILDHSGSMLDAEYGTTRLARAKNELIRVIDQLPADAEFAIMFYSVAVNVWKTELVYATAQNKQDAIYFVNRLVAGTHTNTHGALVRSLEFDDALEAVYLLTDGKPTVGAIVNPQGIINDIVHRNRFRHLNFNTIGVAVDGHTEQFLRRLAEQGAGEFRKAM